MSEHVLRFWIECLLLSAFVFVPSLLPCIERRCQTCSLATSPRGPLLLAEILKSHLAAEFTICDDRRADFWEFLQLQQLCLGAFCLLTEILKSHLAPEFTVYNHCRAGFWELLHLLQLCLGKPLPPATKFEKFNFVLILCSKFSSEIIFQKLGKFVLKFVLLPPPLPLKIHLYSHVVYWIQENANIFRRFIFTVILCSNFRSSHVV